MSLLRNYFFKYQIGTDTQLSFRDSILSAKKFRTSHGETEKERKGNEKGGGDRIARNGEEGFPTRHDADGSSPFSNRE